MLRLNKCTKTTAEPKPTLIFKNCSYVCAYHCAPLSYTTQHRTVLIIFSHILQIIIIAQIMSTGNRRVSRDKWYCSHYTNYELTTFVCSLPHGLLTLVICIMILHNYIPDRHPFNGLFSSTTGVSWNQKSKTILDFR